MTSLHQYKAIIFDRDGTLLQIAPHRAIEINRRLVQAAPQISPATVFDYWQHWPGPWPSTVEAETAFWADFWAQFSTDQVELSAEQCQALTEVALDYHTLFEAYPETASVVQQLHAHSFRLAVLTNFELPSVDRTLSAAGLDLAWFTLRCSAESLGARKPDPKAFLAMARALQLPSEECLLIDDLPEHCLGAQAVGMGAIYLDRTNKDGGSQLLRCTSLSEVPALLGLSSNGA